MTKKNRSILKYSVPIIALLVVASQFFLVNTYNLNKWKGGGFGMYSEVHYYFNEVYIANLNKPLDSLITEDRHIGNVMMDVKRIPTDSNLEKMAKLMSKYVASDTVNIQVWKPLINSKNATYSREFVTQFQYIKP